MSAVHNPCQCSSVPFTCSHTLFDLWCSRPSPAKVLKARLPSPPQPGQPTTGSSGSGGSGGSGGSPRGSSPVSHQGEVSKQFEQAAYMYLEVEAHSRSGRLSFADALSLMPTNHLVRCSRQRLRWLVRHCNRQPVSQAVFDGIMDTARVRLGTYKRPQGGTEVWLQAAAQPGQASHAYNDCT